MKNIAYINFYSYIFPPSVGALMGAIQQKIQQGAEKIVLLISSPGGLVKPGLTLYSFLKGIPVELETHNFGSVDSMAIPIFCAGKRRLCVKNGKFFMHEIGRDLPQGKRLERKEIEEISKSIESDRKSIINLIAENCGKKAEEIDQDLEKTKGLDVKEAIKYGLVHEIKDELFPKGTEVITISFWPNK